MNKLELTLLDYNQITYGEEYLDIMDKVGTRCGITDFAILLGRANGSWWTKTLRCEFDCFIGSKYGGWYWEDVLDRQVGIRPALSYSSISQICTNKVSGFKGITEVEYGEYPQYIVAEELSEILEQLYMNKDITQTSKTYTTDSVEPSYSRIPCFKDSERFCEKEYFVYEYHSEKYNVEKYYSYSKPFRAKGHIVYEYNGKKYVRLEAPSYCTGSVLSNGKEVEEGKAYWLEVEPIKWMIDEKANIALSKNIIVSGIQFDRNNYTGDFEETEIYKFMNYILAKDIIPGNMSKEDIQEGVSSEDILDNDVVNGIEEKSKSNDVDVTEKVIQPETVLEDVPTDDEVDTTNQIVEESSDSNYVNEEAIQVVVASKDILGNDEAEATRQMFEDMTGSNDMEEEVDEVNLDGIDLDDDFEEEVDEVNLDGIDLDDDFEEEVDEVNLDGIDLDDDFEEEVDEVNLDGIDLDDDFEEEVDEVNLDGIDLDDDFEEKVDEVNLDGIDLDDDSVDDFEDLDIADEYMDMVEETTGSNDIIGILMMIIKILTEEPPLPQESIKKINQLLEKMATAYAGSESLVAEISELIKKNQDGLIMPSSDMQFIKQT